MRRVGSIGLEGGILVGSLLVLYLLTLTPNLALAHDSIYYLEAIEQGLAHEGFFHPHHLLYNPLAALWLGVWRSLRVSVDSALVVASLNALAGALASGLVFLMLRLRAALDRPYALVGALLPAVSFGFWFYSVCIEVYMIPLLFLLGAAYLVVAPQLTRWHAVGIGLLHGLAMVFHQVHVLFAVVVLGVALLGRARLAAPLWQLGTLYVAGGTVIVVAAYGWVLLGVHHVTSVEAAFTWLTLYAQDGGSWMPLSLSTAFKAAVGVVRSIVGMHFVFGLEPVQALIARAFPDQFLVDETFLVRQLPSTVAYALLGMAALLGLGLLGALLKGIGALRHARAERQPVIGVAVLWLVTYAAFFFFWDPFNVEFWIPQAVCLWLLLLLAWTPPTAARQPYRLAWLTAALVVLATVNGLGTIGLARNPANDVYRHQLVPLAAIAQPGDLVVLGRSHILAAYVERLTRTEVLSLDERVEDVPTDQALLDTLNQTVATRLRQGHRVFVLPNALAPEPQVLRGLTPEAGTRLAQAMTTFAETYADRLRLQGSADAPYYELEVP